ncbi:MAG: acetyl-CoA carboxylase biotin carboxyl carrier protein [Pseudanabaenaceae cyanobacterium bins.68]|nr:acetyl-CoA carboxylase biotin carboxyl carrier protein [Pseudanabaenaceae cyanobacterium bins.68]
MEFDLEQLRELIKILNHTDIAELTLESGDLRLSIRKGEVISTAPKLPVAAPSAVTPEVLAAPPVPTPSEPVTNRKLAEVTAPMVGTFYRAAAPDEPPFVSVGETVKKGQTMCIIEAMKLMNPIEAEVSGRIAEILVENAQPIEYGQLLMRIELAE